MTTVEDIKVTPFCKIADRRGNLTVAQSGTDLPFEIDELEVRRYLDMAERMFAAIRQQLYEGGRPHEIVQRR